MWTSGVLIKEVMSIHRPTLSLIHPKDQCRNLKITLSSNVFCKDSFLKKKKKSIQHSSVSFILLISLISKVSFSASFPKW